MGRAIYSCYIPPPWRRVLVFYYIMIREMSMIDPKELIETLSVEELCETAESFLGFSIKITHWFTWASHSVI